MNDSLHSSVDDSAGGVNSETTNPTFYGTIRGYFRDKDVQCMEQAGYFDLRNYTSVKTNALRIYKVVEDGSMPHGGPRWSDEMVNTFGTWIRQGCKAGTLPPAKAIPMISNQSTTRIRKNILTLSDAEMNKLKDAFRALYANEGEEYRKLVMIHGLYCLHHNRQYYHWHRLLLIVFEDALRKVSGDSNMTLPYWDFTKPVVVNGKSQEIPDFLQKEPFDMFSSHKPFETAMYYVDIHGNPQYTSQRFPLGYVTEEYLATHVAGDTQAGYSHPEFENFTGWHPATQLLTKGTVTAHDNAHNFLGVTMEDSRFSPYDPIFWFFHCNWDRVWWGWQVFNTAITLDDFKKHLLEDASWVNKGGLDGLAPFVVENGKVTVDDKAFDKFATCTQTLDLKPFNYGYDAIPAMPVLPPKTAMAATRVDAVGTVNIAKNVSPHSQVRVTGVNRLLIPGNFRVNLLVGGKPYDYMVFMQANSPPDCANCAKAGIVNFEFTVLTADIVGKSLEVRITKKNQVLDPITLGGVPEIVVSHGLN